jgi:hypothetical protein
VLGFGFGFGFALALALVMVLVVGGAEDGTAAGVDAGGCENGAGCVGVRVSVSLVGIGGEA